MRTIVILAGLGGLLAAGLVAWATWPHWRPLGRNEAEIASAWAAAEPLMPADLRDPPVPEVVLLTFADVPMLDISDADAEPSLDVVTRVRAWLDADQPLPLRRCDLIEPEYEPHLRGFEVFQAAAHLVAAGHPDDAVALGEKMLGESVLLHTMGIGVVAHAVSEGATRRAALSGDALFEAVAAEVRCVDEVLGRFEDDVQHARNDVGPWSWRLLQPARERLVHRMVYGALLPELHGLRGDPVALAGALEEALAGDEILQGTILASMLSSAMGSSLAETAALQVELSAARPASTNGGP